MRFVINPKAGVKSKQNIPQLINNLLDKNKYEWDICETKYAGHGRILAEDAVKSDTEVVVAVGGDGTVNEVANGLMGSKTALSILPMGSGNGLARHLGIPMNLDLVLKQINYLDRQSDRYIDVGFFNDRPFFCTAGLGFDAFVSHHFANHTQRGLWSYIRTGITHFTSYKPLEYLIQTDQEVFQKKAIILTVANAAQYGNNAFISPQSDIADGFLELCIIRPSHIGRYLQLLYKIFRKTIHHDPTVEIYKTKQISIQTQREVFLHLDGEAVIAKEDRFTFTVKPSYLKVWI
ncbi:MAG: diacylglycerol kinase family lipid kinase [Thermoflexibacter sp.]|nr:diacylglycerol kinase family lipid kinase [Thermoflexibacter sp.]